MATHILTITWPNSWGSGPLVHHSHPFKSFLLCPLSTCVQCEIQLRATLWTKEGDIKNRQTETSKMAQGGGREVVRDTEQQVERWAVLEEVGFMTNPPTFCLLTSHQLIGRRGCIIIFQHAVLSSGGTGAGDTSDDVGRRGEGEKRGVHPSIHPNQH